MNSTFLKKDYPFQKLKSIALAFYPPPTKIRVSEGIVKNLLRLSNPSNLLLLFVLLFSLITSNATAQEEGNCKEEVVGWYNCENAEDIIHCAGNVGIGPFVCTPQQKLEIAHNDERGGIVLNRINLNDSPRTNEIYFSHNSVEQWGMGNDLKMEGGDNGHNFFIWDNIATLTRFYINGNGIGVNTENPVTELDVEGGIRSANLIAGTTSLVQANANGILGNVSISSLKPALNYWTLGSNGWDLYRNTKVFIGMSSCSNCTSSVYSLYVAGGIVTNDLKVTAPTNPWPDFVFDKKYKLKPISELEQYIKENKHLPNIPSAVEVIKNEGFEIGNMQSKLLQTLEEQTLYIIDLQKQLNQLNAEMASIKNK